MMDMTLLSNDSDKFHSCYTHNESTMFHDMSHSGMGSAMVGESIYMDAREPSGDSVISQPASKQLNANT